MIMKFVTTKSIRYIFLFLIIFVALRVHASLTVGTIDINNYTAQICETSSCDVSATSSLLFNNIPPSLVSVTVSDTGLSGFIWSKSLGEIALNCVNFKSGCNNFNSRGNFKVVNNGEGVLSGFAWGENSGWINFGPFKNSKTSQVVINDRGEWNGYAWAENFGWIKFDCSKANYCVKTDWRPKSTRTPFSPPEPQIKPSNLLPKNVEDNKYYPDTKKEGSGFFQFIKNIFSVAPRAFSDFGNGGLALVKKSTTQMASVVNFSNQTVGGSVVETSELFGTFTIQASQLLGNSVVETSGLVGVLATQASELIGTSVVETLIPISDELINIMEDTASSLTLEKTSKVFSSVGSMASSSLATVGEAENKISDNLNIGAQILIETSKNALINLKENMKIVKNYVNNLTQK